MSANSKLPKEWSVHVSRSTGKRYIWNSATNERLYNVDGLDVCWGFLWNGERKLYKNVLTKVETWTRPSVHNELNNTSKTAKNSHPPAERKVNNKRNFEKMSSGTDRASRQNAMIAKASAGPNKAAKALPIASEPTGRRSNAGQSSSISSRNENVAQENPSPPVFVASFPPSKPQAAQYMLTWYYDCHEHLLKELFRTNVARCIVEIGSFYGGMTKQFRKFAPQAQIFAIDKYDIQYVATHQSDQYLEKELQAMVNYPMLKTFYFNLWNEQERINPKTGVVEGVTPIQGDSIEAIKFLKSCGVVPDVVFVDGDHTYEKVLQDLEQIIELWGPPIICQKEEETAEDSAENDDDRNGVEEGSSNNNNQNENQEDKEDESIERETIYTIAGCGYEHDGVKRAVLEISMKYNMPVYLDTDSAWTYTPINRRKVHLVEWIKNVQNYDAKRQFYTIFKLCDQEGDKVSTLQWRLGKGNDCYTARKYVNHFDLKTRKSWLMVAVDKGNINIANTLIQAYGADVNQANEERLTPLHIAAYNGYRNIALLLLKHGANRSMENKWGEKPAETARAKGEENLANLIHGYTEKTWEIHKMTFRLAPVKIEKVDSSDKDVTAKGGDDGEGGEAQLLMEKTAQKKHRKRMRVVRRKKKAQSKSLT